MTEFYLAIIATLLTILVGLVGWIGRHLATGMEALGAQIGLVIRCHLRRHPEDLDQFKIGGSV